MIDSVWDALTQYARSRKRAAPGAKMGEIRYMRELFNGTIDRDPAMDGSPIHILYDMSTFIAGLSQNMMQKRYCQTFMWTLLPRIFGEKFHKFKQELHKMMHVKGRQLALSVLACERQGGKSWGVAQMCVAMLLHLPKVRILLASSSKRAASQVLVYVGDFLNDMPEAVRQKCRINAEKIHFHSGIDDKRSLLPAAILGNKIRGSVADVIIVDEAAALSEDQFERGLLGIIVKSGRVSSFTSTINTRQGGQHSVAMGRSGALFSDLLTLTKLDEKTGLNVPAIYTTHWRKICATCAKSDPPKMCKCFVLYPMEDDFDDLRTTFAPLVSEAAAFEEMYGIEAKNVIYIERELVEKTFEPANAWKPIRSSHSKTLILSVDPHAGGLGSNCAMMVFFQDIDPATAMENIILCGMDEFRDNEPFKFNERLTTLLSLCARKFMQFADVLLIIEDSMGSASGRTEGICQSLAKHGVGSGIAHFVTECAGNGREHIIGVSSDAERKRNQWKTLHGLITQNRLRIHEQIEVRSEYVADTRNALRRLKNQILQFDPLKLTGKKGDLGLDDQAMALMLGPHWVRGRIRSINVRAS